jgi:type 1 glutamine amidotransferase
MIHRCVVVCLMALFACTTALHAADKLKVLLVDGQNNHDWKSCQPILKWILEDCGRFTVDISTTPPAAPRAPQKPKGQATAKQQAAYEKALAKYNEEKAGFAKTTAEAWKQWHPKFSNYDVVVSNYNGEDWPEDVRKEFVEYVKNGGGLVIVHAADNAFGKWPEYNEMIGVGGWGGRNEKSGPMIRFRDGKMVLDTTPGAGGTHGAQSEFVVETREPEHPIMKGLPLKWKHAQDELYAKLRGPARNVTVLATAYSDPATRGTGEIEPILMTIAFGKGRVFHTVLGHGPLAMSGYGFQVTLQRGTEWAATGKVTLPAPKPEDLPADKAAMRAMK